MRFDCYNFLHTGYPLGLLVYDRHVVYVEMATRNRVLWSDYCQCDCYDCECDVFEYLVNFEDEKNRCLETGQHDQSQMNWLEVSVHHCRARVVQNNVIRPGQEFDRRQPLAFDVIGGMSAVDDWDSMKFSLIFEAHGLPQVK